MPTPAPTASLYVPNVSGIVVNVTYGAQDVRYTLGNGRQFSFSQSGFIMAGSEPQKDGLLIAGSAPGPWLTWAGLRVASATTPAGCYALYGNATANATQVFQTVSSARGDVVIVFPKSPNWVDHGVEASGSLSGGYTCMNAQGEAFERGL
ncbi:MAG TPA: hypothetical protein VFI15_02590 [Candidatus Limnocylindrales bacterium]|nr:hypothetical protein [Candidatus Limnocylindrales bacterium]